MTKSILLVCLGNICRSPLAEGILRDKLAASGLKTSVASAGTLSWHAGHPPDKRSVQVAQKSGVDITMLRGRHFTSSDFDRYDLILVMDTDNRADVLSLARNDSHASKVHLLLEYAGMGVSACVPDPYYGNEKDFQSVYQMLDEACDRVIRQLKAASSNR